MSITYKIYSAPHLTFTLFSAEDFKGHDEE